MDAKPMRRFALAHASGTRADKLAEALLRQLEDTAAARFGFIYASDALAPVLPELLRALRQATGVVHWTGGVGIALCVTGQEYYDTPAVAVMLADFPPDAVRALPVLRAPGDVEAFVSAEQDWLEREAGRLFAILHGDPGNPATPVLIEQLASRLPDMVAVGGLTSSQGDNLQVTGGEVVSGGVSGALFSPRIAVAAGHTQGCTPIGPPRRITRSERNVLLELDGRPALDVFKEDIGEVLARDLKRVAGYIFAALPVAESEDGDYLVRNLIGIDTGRRLLAIGDLAPEGGQLMFCRRDGNTARLDLQRMLGDLQGRCEAPARGGLYVSCLGRGRYQFGPDSQELRLIQEALGRRAFAGFFRRR